MDGADQLTYALRNVRVLIRRTLNLLAEDETVPEVLPQSVRLLADAVDLLQQEWARAVEPLATRERALRAAVEAGKAYSDGVGFSGGVVVAQVRSTATDLLRATGIEYAEATRLVRRAAGWDGRPRGRRNRT